MELEEMKAGWLVLNERLEKNEILNKRIIKEMVESRTKSAYSKLYRYDLFGVIVLVLMMGLLPFLAVHTKLAPSALVLVEVIMGLGLCIQLYQFSFLLRMDVETKSIFDLTRLTLQYKLWVKRISVFSLLIVIPVMGAIIMLRHVNMEAVGNIIIVSMAFLIALFITFINLRFYNKNVATIIKGLDELKEFGE